MHIAHDLNDKKIVQRYQSVYLLLNCQKVKPLTNHNVALQLALYACECTGVWCV